YHQNLGIDIQHIKRVHRRGFKAGALKEASKLATGEFVAIFDADFLPSPSLLRTTIDHFTDEKVGMVQFRWEHLNRGSSRFTEAQSIMLDAHFALEQQVRCASDMLLNFNGTAGMWRAKTIIEAGDWSADTLTEDLDLSYRAQMCGWKMVFLSDIECPGEIPADMNAFKSQQHRWAKGGIQVMKKLLLRVWKSPYSVGKKIESSFHLMNNLAYFIVLFDTLFFLIPSLWVREKYQVEQIFWLDVPLLILATGGHLIYLFFGQVALGRSKWAATKHLPWLMLMGIQLAFNNARAGLEALIGQKSEFVRTPKTGEMHIEKSKQSRVYQTFYSAVLPKSALIELLVSLVYFAVLLWSIEHQKWAMLPFLLLLVLGFASAALANVWQHITVRKSSC
ncbi:MAG: cellulose synthase/poly-beta-1,6-N-acetylglucosamine synthase-like glycosyltransferase, partial [Lentisphaeria bacterium]